MKIKSLFAIALAATTLFSCNKNNESTGVPSGEAATLRVNLASGGTTRATESGTPMSTTDDVITDVNIFITDNTNEIKWSQYFTAAQLTGLGGNEAAMTVETTATRVYVIANAGANLTASITSMALLNAKEISMGTAGENPFTSRWATGDAAIPAFTFNGTDWESTTTVTADFVAARITVKIVDNMSPTYDGTATNGDLVIHEVAVLNAVSNSKLFGTSLVPTTKHYFTGIDGGAAGWSPFPAAADFTQSTLMLDPIATDDFTETYYYYVFSNDAIIATDFPTIVTIRGEVDSKDIYYPVHLAPYEQFLAGAIGSAGLERGKSYDITMTLSVDPTDHNGGGGVNPPVTPIVTANITVEIDINDWVPVVLSKEFK